MTDQTTAGPSARWGTPVDHGTHWSATVRYRVSDRERAYGIESQAFGPSRDAVIAECGRLDRTWALWPSKHGDAERSRERVRFLASGGADGNASGDGDADGTTDGGAA